MSNVGEHPRVLPLSAIFVTGQTHGSAKIPLLSDVGAGFIMLYAVVCCRKLNKEHNLCQLFAPKPAHFAIQRMFSMMGRFGFLKSV